MSLGLGLCLCRYLFYSVDENFTKNASQLVATMHDNTQLTSYPELAFLIN